MLKPIFRAFLSLYVFLYRLTGGKFGGKVQGLTVLLLTTRGRKTGKTRTTPLGYFQEDGGYVITASNAGADAHPAWYLNLRNDPHVTIEVKDQHYKVSAEIAEGENRDRLWKKLITLAPGYASYEKKTSRKIPVIVLRAGDNSA